MNTFFAEMGSFFSAFEDSTFRIAVIKDFFSIILEYFVQLFPYVVLGSALGELLKFTSWTKLIYKFTYKYRIWGIVCANILGILSPLCTFGTVPVLITLYQGGVPLAALISFLASSSMMNPQLFIVTVGGLGWKIALLRLLLVFLASLLCGFLTLTLPQKFVVKEKLAVETENIEAIENRKPKKFTFKEYGIGLIKNLWFVFRMMLIGILIATIVDILPMQSLFSDVDTNTPLGILLAAVAGIPLYACGGGTVPMIASLMAQGMSLGSALAFLVVGPATRITSLAAISSIFKKRFLLCYVLVLIIFSVIAGLIII